MDELINESPPVFYRTLSPSGPLPKKPKQKPRMSKVQEKAYPDNSIIIKSTLHCIKTRQGGLEVAPGARYYLND